MSIEESVDNLVTQTTALLAQVTTSKAALDNAVEMAQKWAETPVDAPVVEGETPEANTYSALHWAAKAEVSQGIAGSFATSASQSYQSILSLGNFNFDAGLASSNYGGSTSWNAGGAS